jgi:hypothetical protein
MNALMVQYASAVYRANNDPNEEPRERVKRLGKSLRDVVRLRRCELAGEQAEIHRERAKIQREKTDEGQMKKLMEMVHDRKVLQQLKPAMSDEERALRISMRLFPDLVSAEDKAKFAKLERI